MTLSPQASERHVDEAIRLFNFSTMNAIQSGMGNLAPLTNVVEGVTRGKFSEEVNNVENLIRRRFGMGASMPVQRLREELIKHEYSEQTVDRAIYQLAAREVLVYSDRKNRITRVRL